ncbi:hypothetical protein ACFYYB_21060 [Streptomyces sp. NPDC002886]|uniref:hypothetical protein n=1 Tax=Streptomyces sp. NPDC002886 TaxID=3364667 RepID=UPI00369009D8
MHGALRSLAEWHSVLGSVNHGSIVDWFLNALTARAAAQGLGPARAQRRRHAPAEPAPARAVPARRVIRDHAG